MADLKPASQGLMDAVAAAKASGAINPEPEPDNNPEPTNDLPEEPTEPTPGSGLEPSEGEPSSDPVPDSYMGFDLTSIEDDEARRAAYDSLREADRVANARLREAAEARKQAEEKAREEALQSRYTQQPEPEVEELSDEELLATNGFDPEILKYEDYGKPIVQLLRNQLNQQAEVEAMRQQQAAAAWENQFFAQFEALEDQYGELPYDRQTIEQHAIENNIGDPSALYWSIAGPIHAQQARGSFGQQPSQVRETKRRVAAGVRPRTSSPEAVTPDTKPKSLIDIYKQSKKAQEIPESVDPFDSSNRSLH